MNLRTVALLILFALPALAGAQEPPAVGTTHTVQSGETLGEIARSYFGSAAAWQRIYEANRDRIDDPDRISPGLVLRIPGVAAQARAREATPVRAADAAPATVFGVEVAGAELRRDVPAYVARRDLTRRVEFRPRPVDDPGDETRTVFYDVRRPEDARPVVVLAPPEEVVAVPRAVFQAAGWLARGDERLGEILAFAGDQDLRHGRTTVHPYDDVRVQFDVEGAPQVGDRFMVYRERRQINGIGTVLTPSGILEVRQLDEAGVVARMIVEFDRVELGNLITRTRTFPLSPGVHPLASETRLEASLLAFQEQKELQLPGDFAFVDVGAEAGLAVGDEFVARAGGEEGWSGRPAARFQVVGVAEGSATVRIMSTNSPSALVPGLRMRVDRKMP